MTWHPDTHHHTHHHGWLRAAVLGANDGIISTASLIMGVASSGATHEAIMLSGLAGLVAGAMSMAAGEYVSVSSQADSEQANLAIERHALSEHHELELQELTDIYIARGLAPDLAKTVAEQLTAKDALGAHARDELGLTEINAAQPLQAAVASALSFALGAAAPLVIAIESSLAGLPENVSLFSVIILAILGGMAAKKGSANVLKGATRVAFWGALAMMVTAIIGRWFGVSV